MAGRKFETSGLPITCAVASALLLGACGNAKDVAQSDVAVCRDANGVRTADANCARSGGGVGGGHGMNGAIMGAAAWYYLSRGSVVPRMGQSLAGGYTSPRAGTNYARASAATVSRGGFGSGARSGGGVGA